MSKRHHRGMQALAIISVALLLPTLLFAAGIDFSPGLLSYVKSRWGDGGLDRVQSWQKFLVTQKATPISLQIEQNGLLSSNSFWNHIPYYTDKEHWGVDDYWATPIEMLGSNGGDCEDYSIGKYFTLKDLGVPLQKLRIVVVLAFIKNGTQMALEHHMVLAYYPEPNSDPLILDNLKNEILPASKRTDLDPVFSFNDDDLWSQMNNSKSGKSSQIRLWQDLLDKMAKEQKL
jgi:predicted transglutaminase-like cysteine proteinase